MLLRHSVDASIHQVFSNSNTGGRIEFQKRNCDPPYCYQWLNLTILEAKMLTPALLAWVIERRQVACQAIVRCDITSFCAVTLEAGVRKVRICCATTMFPGNDMIWFMRIGWLAVWHKAILTLTRSAFADSSAQGDPNPLAHRAPVPANC